MTELKMKEMQIIHWFGCPNLNCTRERIHLVAMLTTDEEMKKNLYRVCRFLAREEIAYRYPIMYEMIRKIFSPMIPIHRKHVQCLCRTMKQMMKNMQWQRSCGKDDNDYE